MVGRQVDQPVPSRGSSPVPRLSASPLTGPRGAMSSNDLVTERAAQSRLDVAVLVPCYNEERAIAQVVADFRAALPDARVYVYDNNSTDGTAAAATDAGAVLRRE